MQSFYNFATLQLYKLLITAKNLKQNHINKLLNSAINFTTQDFNSL